MFTKGQKVNYSFYNDHGDLVTVPAIFNYQFYEPGDPIPGANITLLDGSRLTIDIQDIRPL